MRVAVTGASGFFGHALESALAPRGPLRGLFRSRSESSERWQATGHEVVFGDLSDTAALEALVSDVDTVYHCAARTGKDDPRASREVNVYGTARLARVSHAASVRRFMYVSSISVYSATPHDGVITEEQEPQQVGRLNAYSESKYQGEVVLRELAREGEGPSFTIIRPTNVYGARSRPWFLDWVRRIERIPIVLGGNIPIDVVHIDDVVAALVQAAEANEATNEVLHIGHETILLGDFVQYIGRAVGQEVRKLPNGIDYVARAILEAAYPIVKGGRRSPSLIKSVHYPHDKARRLIAYCPRIRVADWQREHYEEQLAAVHSLMS